MAENEEYHLLKDDNNTNSNSKNKSNCYSTGSTTHGLLVLKNKDNSFLFFYTPKEIESQCFCGCDLGSGMKLTIIFLTFQFILNFVKIFKLPTFSAATLFLILAGFYFASICFIMFACYQISYENSTIAYSVYMITCIIDLIFFIADSSIYIYRQPDIFYSYNLLWTISYFLFEIILFVIEYYTLWITFCFKTLIQQEKIYLLQEESIEKFLQDNP